MAYNNSHSNNDPTPDPIIDFPELIQAPHKDKTIDELLNLAREIAPSIVSTQSVEAVKYTPAFWTTINTTNVETTNDEVVQSATRRLWWIILDLQSPHQSEIPSLAAKLALQIRHPHDLRKLLIPLAEIKVNTQYIPGISANLTIDRDTPTQTPFQTDIDFKKQLIQQIYNLSPQQCLVWGPYSALLVLRLENRSSISSANKLVGLSSTLSKAYANVTGSYPTAPQQTEIQPFFEKIQNRGPGEILKNTLLYGLMRVYHKSTTLSNLKGLIDFCLLQGSRYSGMMILTLVDQVCTEFKMGPGDLMDITSYKASLSSWNAYWKTVSVWLNEESKLFQTDKFWQYSKEFSAGVFQELSYPNNVWLCNILATLLDFSRHPDKSLHNDDIRPIYNGIIGPRKNLPKMNREDFELAHQIFKVLHREHRIEPLTAKSRMITENLEDREDNQQQMPREEDIFEGMDEIVDEDQE